MGDYQGILLELKIRYIPKHSQEYDTKTLHCKQEVDYSL